MIKRTYSNRRVNIIIDMILAKIEELDMNIEFDNEYTNHFALIIDGDRYEFTTYSDVYKTLKLMCLIKRKIEN